MTRQGLLVLLLLAVVLLLVTEPAAAVSRRIRIRVRTACQGNKLTLRCHSGFSISVLAAFYGHASGSVCPSLLGHHPYKGAVRCAAKGTLTKVRQLCKGKQYCRLRALSSVFGNPCHKYSVRKYLRVRYTCTFRDCKRIVRLQGKIVHLIARYGELARTSYGYWRRRHCLRRKHQLQRKLNHIRGRFRFCFKCKRGCADIEKLLESLAHAETRIRLLMKRDKPHKHKRRAQWHANRWFLKRKLHYLIARQRHLEHRLRQCKQDCHF